MALEDPNNVEKDSPAASQDPADETEHGAVKKKIEIPGVGEIEYTEKTVMFPEKIVQETGGVKGYVRKMVSWDELARYWNVDREELERIKCGEFSNSDQFKKAEGIKKIILALTNGEFIYQTLSHLVNRGSGKDRQRTQKDKLFEKIKIKRTWKPFDSKSNKLLSGRELCERLNLSNDFMDKLVLSRGYSHPKEIFESKLLKEKGVYLESDEGFHLTNAGQLWEGYKFQKNNDIDSPRLNCVVMGFKMDTQNSVLRRYCSKVLNLMEKQKDDFETLRYYRDRRRSENERTLKGLLEPIPFIKDGVANKVYGGSLDEGSHPRIPIVLNHPDIPELRWCHADYAAIPTKNGYNIIEMIT